MANIQAHIEYEGTFELTDVINLNNFLNHISNYDQPEWSAICGFIQQETGIDFRELCDDIETVVEFMTEYLV